MEYDGIPERQSKATRFDFPLIHDRLQRTQHGNGFWEFIDMLPPLWMSSFSVQPVTNPGTSIVMEIVGGRLNELCPRSITLMKIVEHI